MKKVEYIDLNKKNDEILERIKSICPEYFQEEEFDIETFYQRFKNESENNNERYGLWWKGKIESSKKIINDNSKTLSPIKEKSLNFDNAKNIIIEGNNLDVLKILKNSYLNSIDVIYIDPPYNTGNDFIYNDNNRMSVNEYKEIQNEYESKNSQTSARYHTNWLNMIYPRLKLARSFLKEDGFICISIDDNEQARLKIICDEIFGEQNFVSCMIWDKRNAQNDNKYIERNHEYILFYAKNKTKLEINRREIKNKNKKHIELTIGSSEGGFLVNRPKLGWTMYWNPTTNEKIPMFDYDVNDIEKIINCQNIYTDNFELINKGFIAIRPRVQNNKQLRWTWSLEKAQKNIDDIIVKQKKDGSYSLFTLDKRDVKSESSRSILVSKKEEFEEIEETIDIFSLKDINGKHGINTLKEIDMHFSNPKSIGLIKYIIDKNKNKNAIVLDFFAGSGTTGHAVMELNKEDGGNRQYILIQLDEKVENNDYETISEITRNRIMKFAKKNNYVDGNFKFFKVVNSNFKTLSTLLDETLFNSKIKDGTNNIDLFYEIILKSGLDLNHKFISITIENIEYYYDEGVTNIFAIFNSNYLNLTKHIFEIKKGMEDTETNLYLREDFFENDNQKINILKLLENKYKNIIIKVI